MVCGIFIGGRSRRMEGFPKALLRLANGETLLGRAVRVAREAGLEPVLVGDAPHVRTEERACADLRVLADAAPDAGPLGGLLALLDAANGDAVALACDMPRVGAEDLRRLAAAASRAAVLAPRRAGRWEPLFARYDSRRVAAIARERLLAGELALQGLLHAAGADVLALEDASMLDDVDTTADAERAGLSREHS